MKLDEFALKKSKAMKCIALRQGLTMPSIISRTGIGMFDLVKVFESLMESNIIEERSQGVSGVIKKRTGYPFIFLTEKGSESMDANYIHRLEDRSVA